MGDQEEERREVSSSQEQIRYPTVHDSLSCRPLKRHALLLGALQEQKGALMLKPPGSCYQKCQRRRIGGGGGTGPKSPFQKQKGKKIKYIGLCICTCTLYFFKSRPVSLEEKELYYVMSGLIMRILIS